MQLNVSFFREDVRNVVRLQAARGIKKLLCSSSGLLEAENVQASG
jgi:hypothetical protein